MASYNSVFRNKPTGTIGSQGLYQQPASSGSNLPTGTQFSDGRAYTRNVNANETVAGQLQGLLDTNNPYLRQGLNRANRQAQAMGMGRSSIAVGNAQAALVNAAMPIASQDASTYGAAASGNQSALNSNLMQERDLRNQIVMQQEALAQADRSSGNQLAAARYGQDMNLQLQRENLAFSGEQNQLDRLQQMAVGAQNYQYDIGRMDNDYANRDALASNDTFRQDWLSNNQYNRAINQSLINAGISNMSGMYQYLTEAAINDPDVYDPEAYAGMLQFFNNQFADLFSGMFGGGG